MRKITLSNQLQFALVFMCVTVTVFSSCQERKGESPVGYRKCDSFPDIDSLIVLTDTVVDSRKIGDQVVNFYDVNGRRLKKYARNLFESNIEKVHFLTTWYDTAGRIIHENKIEGTHKWYCCIYEYDEKGRLILQDSYDLGKPLKKVTYVYRGDMLVQEITEDENGRKVREL